MEMERGSLTWMLIYEAAISRLASLVIIARTASLRSAVLRLFLCVTGEAGPARQGVFTPPELYSPPQEARRPGTTAYYTGAIRPLGLPSGP